MKSLERRKGEGRGEHLARLGVAKSLGFAALAAAGAVMIPPVGAPLAAAAMFEGLQAGAFGITHQHLKAKRLKKGKSNI
jgi:hypothetical protein